MFLKRARRSGNVRLWIVRLEDLAEIGCRKLRRSMTREEWNRYLPGREYRKTCEQ